MTQTVQVQDEPQVRAAFWEDLVDIFLSPQEVFERRRDGRFVPALILLTIVVTLLVLPTQMSLSGAVELTLREGLPASAAEQLTPEQMARMGRISVIGGTLATLVGTPIGILVTGVLIWGASAALGVSIGPAPGIMIATYSAFPRIWSLIATMLQGALMDPQRMHHVSVGPARFLGADSSPLLVGLLGRLDVLVIWSLVLLAIGVATVGRTSRGRGWIVAAIVWAIASIPTIIGGIFAMRA